MYISGNPTLNFRTINDFRCKNLKNRIHTLFAEVVKWWLACDMSAWMFNTIDGP
jgi:hypothetical protein